MIADEWKALEGAVVIPKILSFNQFIFVRFKRQISLKKGWKTDLSSFPPITANSPN